MYVVGFAETCIGVDWRFLHFKAEASLCLGAYEEDVYLISICVQ